MSGRVMFKISIWSDNYVRVEIYSSDGELFATHDDTYPSIWNDSMCIGENPDNLWFNRARYHLKPLPPLSLDVYTYAYDSKRLQEKVTLKCYMLEEAVRTPRKEYPNYALMLPYEE